MFWRNISINSEAKQDFERRKSKAFWERLMSKRKEKRKNFKKNRDFYFLTITSIEKWKPSSKPNLIKLIRYITSYARHSHSLACFT